MSITLKTKIRLRYDTSTEAISHSKLVLAEGEPFYIQNYFYKGQNRNVLLIGDNTNNVDLMLASGKFFIEGAGAGYDLPIASTNTLGGIKVDKNHGIKVGSSGDAWVDVKSIAGENLKLSEDLAYDGYGKLNVDLTNYEGDVSIAGTLVANKMLSTPVLVGNVFKLREPEYGADEPNPLAGNEIAGLEVQYVTGKDSAIIGVDNTASPIFRNINDDYRIPLISKNNLTEEIKIIGIDSRGMLFESNLQNINIKVRDNKTSPSWTTTTIDVTSNTEQSVELTIPRRLSDLEDYIDDPTGPTYVSAEDRTVWNNVILDVSMDTNITDPYLLPYNAYGRTVNKLVIPRTNVTAGDGLEISSDKITLQKVTVTNRSVEIASPQTITYISNITVDEYGRVKEIEKTTAIIR